VNDIETEAFEVADEILTATNRLLDRIPDARPWTVCIGHRAPYIIQYRRTTLYADLGAERPIAAERGEQKLVVEVKSFIGASKIQDLKEALGQYDIYRYLLEETDPDRKFISLSAK
jgi:hypothetical protein